MPAGDMMTRDELAGMIAVQSKNVEQLTVIANHLATIVERENKIYDRLYNGIAKEISTAVIEAVEESHLSTNKLLDAQAACCANACKAMPELIKKEMDGSKVATDMGHVKWFIGIVGVVIIVASVIVNLISKKSVDDAFMHDLKTAVSDYTNDVLVANKVVRDHAI